MLTLLAQAIQLFHELTLHIFKLLLQGLLHDFQLLYLRPRHLPFRSLASTSSLTLALPLLLFFGSNCCFLFDYFGSTGCGAGCSG